jgi:hypothetical protein
VRAPVERLCALVCGLLVAGAAHAYQGSLHQQLTFVAAKQFNHCVGGSEVPLLTPLEVRYIARTNVAQAERNVFSRMFNWRYYDRGRESERSVLWAVDTRFHEHFNEILARLGTANDTRKRYSNLGRLISYIQVVSSPAHSVPVYTARFWRLSLADKFDDFPVDETALSDSLDCDFLQNPAADYQAVMRAVATDTLLAVRAPIPGLPASWEAFWTPAEELGSFGDYGPAGNSFGRKTEFPCSDEQRCVLLRNDPLYEEFARQRHLAAVNGTMSAMLLMQQSRRSQQLAEVADTDRENRPAQ